jgi:hypothetical protein
MDDYLAKPIDSMQLQKMIAGIVPEPSRSVARL